MADDAAVLLVAARQVARHVDEGDDRDPERVAESDEARRLHRRVDVDRTCQMLRLVAHDADDVAGEPAQADNDVLGEEGLDLEELTVVEDTRHQLPHVVWLVRRLGHDGLQLGVRALAVVSGGDEGRTLVVARGQVGQQAPHARCAFILRARQEVRHAGGGVVDVTATELVKGHGFAGDHADHLGSGDEHVPLSRDDEDEVGDRRRVDRAAGAWARDDADLRDHAGRANVAVEDVRVAGQRDHAFLDARAT